jgi:hypothetical protein
MAVPRWLKKGLCQLPIDNFAESGNWSNGWFAHDHYPVGTDAGRPGLAQTGSYGASSS